MKRLGVLYWLAFCLLLVTVSFGLYVLWLDLTVSGGAPRTLSATARWLELPALIMLFVLIFLRARKRPR